ncbi:MAG: CoA pyrophosphatase [Pseudomonadota bacterium]
MADPETPSDPPLALADWDEDRRLRLMGRNGSGIADALYASLLPDAPDVGPIGHEAAIGDHVLNPDFATFNAAETLKPAAVLIAVDHAQSDPVVTLTVRTANLAAHAGQIAFPGGRMDAGESPRETAVREAEEEVALPRQAVDVQGYLPPYLSRTGYRVFPVVGRLDATPVLTPNPGEVETIFQVPLRFLLDPANAQLESRVFQGKRRYFYLYQFANHAIWGLTAGIIHHMSVRLLSADL